MHPGSSGTFLVLALKSPDLEKLLRAGKDSWMLYEFSLIIS